MEYNQEYTNYQLDRGFIRRFIREFYMNHTLRYVKGRAVDFGCGIGDLLRKLPPGSLGYEINETSVRYCRQIGLNAELYDPQEDNYRLRNCQTGFFGTLILSHVLEHLEQPDNIFRLLLQSCQRLGIERIIVVVPGLKGFHHDKTHRTFINKHYVEARGLNNCNGYFISKTEYFPFGTSWMGNFFAHNETVLIYDRRTL